MLNEEQRSNIILCAVLKSRKFDFVSRLEMSKISGDVDMVRNPSICILCGATSLLWVLLFSMKNVKNGGVMADLDDTNAFQ